jgi:trimethylamine--corrinoid protein Co-methyltransferase
MQRDYFYPTLADRDEPRTWKEKGAPDLWSRARERARGILSAHYPDYLPEATDLAIRERFRILLPRERMRPA